MTENVRTEIHLTTWLILRFRSGVKRTACWHFGATKCAPSSPRIKMAAPSSRKFKMAAVSCHPTRWPATAATTVHWASGVSPIRPARPRPFKYPPTLTSVSTSILPASGSTSTRPASVLTSVPARTASRGRSRRAWSRIYKSSLPASVIPAVEFTIEYFVWREKILSFDVHIYICSEHAIRNVLSLFFV